MTLFFGIAAILVVWFVLSSEVPYQIRRRGGK